MTARKIKRFICTLISVIAGLSAIRADDTPHPTCSAVAPRLLEIYPIDNLSGLTERERINVSHYLSAREDRTRARIYLYRSLFRWEPQPNLSLVFPVRDCETTCTGTAILPQGDKFRFIDFSYRKNIITEPYFGKAEVVDGFQYKRSKSHIFMDSEERNFLAFFDFQRLPADLPWNLETLKHAQSVGSGTSLLSSLERPVGYGACFKNLFEVEGAIP